MTATSPILTGSLVRGPRPWQNKGTVLGVSVEGGHRMASVAWAGALHSTIRADRLVRIEKAKGRE